jgi:uncharacterized delta-60 repeat protein
MRAPSVQRLGLAAVAVLCIAALAATLWLRRGKTEARSANAPAPDDRPRSFQPASPAGATPLSARPISPPPGAPGAASRDQGDDLPAFARFDAWARAFAAADLADRAALLAEGEALARDRRAALRELIQSDPERALALAVPWGVRRALPPAIQALLEEPISSNGQFTVKIYCPLPGQEGLEPPPRRQVRLEDGRLFEAHVFGWRTGILSRQNLAVHGIAVDDQLAMAAEAWREVPAEEAADLVAAGRATVAPACQVCGRAGAQTLLDSGTGQFQTVCAEDARTMNQAVEFALARGCSQGCAAHGLAAGAAALSTLNLQLPTLPQFQLPVQAYGGGGPSTNLPAPPPGLLGQRRLLLIPAQFADEADPPATRQAAENAGLGVHNYYNRASYGYEQMRWTVVPGVKLPQRMAVYDETGDGRIINDAIALATAQGYNVGAFDFVYVITTAIPSARFGGISSGLVFGAGAGVLIHEIGHNNGLGHANLFNNARPANPTQPNPALPFDPDSVIGHPDVNGPFINSLSSPVTGGNGSILEYGDEFDTMGGGGGDFSASMKASLGWLPRQFVRAVAGSETNRLYAFDAGSVTNGRLYALQVRRNNFWGDYWLSHRRALANQPWLQFGVLLQHGGATTLQLDTTPATPSGRFDGPVVIGRTFSDPEAHVHITPIARGGSGADAFIDVVVQRGPFPANVPPEITGLQAGSDSVAVGAPVTFSVSATDADGDALAYHFDFGDQTFSTNNAPVVTKAWTAAGRYVVRCEVSDTRGGVDSRNVVITVGAPGLFTISGRVVDTDGQPIQGVRVHNGVAPPADNGTPPISPGGYRFGYTDSDGYYTIQNVAPGTYTVGAFIYRYRTEPLNFNGVVQVAAADLTGVDFMATPIPRVSVAVATNAAEPAVTGAFRVTRTGPVTNDLAVKMSLTTPDSAGFTASATTNIVIPTGSAFADVIITPVNNAVGDGGRTVRMNVLLQTNYTQVVSVFTNNMFILVTNNISVPGWEALPRPSDGARTWYLTHPHYVIGDAEAAMTILDDDPPGTPQVSIAAANTGVVEGSRDVGNFVITRANAPITNALTVNLGLAGSATNGVDYLTVPPAFTIPAGERFVVVPIIPINNYFVESNRTVLASILAGPGYNASPGVATLTIVDDDLPSVAVYANDPQAGRSGNNGQFTVVRSGDVTRDLVVNYLVTGTAVAGTDYQVLGGSVTLPAGALSATVTVTPTATPSSPGPKSVVLVVSSSPNYNIAGEGRATVTISDLVPTVTVASSGNATEGGGSGGFTITRTGATTNALTVYFAVGGSANPNTDYAGIGTNAVIPVGSASVTIPITPVNDSYREYTTTAQNNDRQNEHETVEIALLAHPTYDVGNPGSATVTITDDDGGAFPGVSFLTQQTVVREDAGTVSIPVRISGNPTNNPALPVLISWAITGGTAVNGVNYVASPASGTLSFVSNAVPMGGFYAFTSQIEFLPFSILDDGVVTSSRTFIITLDYFQGTLTNGTNVVPYPTNAFLGDYRTHTVVIEDVDSATVSVAATTTLAYETGPQNGGFRITRTGSTAAPLTVNLFAGGTAVPGADYVALPATITIPAGTNAVDLPVIPIDDVEQELAESVILTLAETAGVKFGTRSATVVLVDNDGTVQFTLASYDVGEGAGVATVDVLRTGETNNTVTVDYVITGGTAGNGVDFLGTNGTLTFPPGSSLQTITIPLVDDLLVEPSETILLTLTNATGGAPLGGQRTAVLTILDNDVAFEFASTNFSAYENATNAAIVVRRLGVTNAALTVDLLTADGTAVSGADYAGLTNTLTFAAGETSKVVTISLANDVLVEGDETVQLILANPSGGATLGALSNALLTIVDDEARVEIVSAAYSFIEYASFAQIELRRTGGTRHPLTVGYAVVNGTATNGLDFAQPAAGTVTFAGDNLIVLTDGSGQTVFVPGETRRVINIPLLDDALGEGNETFSVVLTNLTGPGGLPAGTFALGAQTNTVVTLVDDEQPGFVDYAYRPVIAGGATGGGGSGPTTVLAGTARNAVNGQGLAGVLVSAGGGSAVTDAQGGFVITNVPVGSVTVGGSLTGFIPFSGSFTLTNQATNGIEFAMSPIISGPETVRLVLTWGAEPRDLDAHLDTPEIAGTNFHVFFGAPGSLADLPFAQLDVDDVDGFGPETITITNTFPGTYSYYVHRFSGAGNLAGSGARVQVFTEAGLVATVTVPTNGVGDYWHVAQIDGDSRAISVINSIVTAPPAVATNLVPVIQTQPQSRTVDAGASTTFTVLAGGSSPLSYQWRRGGVPLAGQTNTSLVLTNVSPADAGTYTVLVTNFLGSVTSAPAVLTVNVACGSGVSDGLVYALGLDTNGNKAVVGGAFTTVDGLVLRRIARLNPSGQVDASFNPGSGANSNVFAVAVQPDGRVLIGGVFTNVDGSNRVRVARLTVDGGVDPLFTVGAGANNTVRALAVQADGKVLVGGEFTAFAGNTNLAYLARLETNGAPDLSFNPQVNGPVLALAVQTNGAIVAGGCFTAAGGDTRIGLARLLASGTNDASFNPGAGFSGAVRAVAVQPDGKILAGGAFTTFDGAPVGFIARLNANGSLDNTFLAGSGADAPVNAIAVAPKGKIYVAGAFNAFNGQTRRGFTRLTPAGAMDLLFTPGTGADGPVYAAVAQADSALLIGGAFTQVNGVPRTGLARIHGDEKSVLVEVEFASAAYSVVENAGSVAVEVVRSGNLDLGLTLDVLTVNGSATAGTDFTGGVYPVVFATNQASATVNIPIADNLTVEGDRSFSLRFTNLPANVLLGAVTNTTVTILDNEQTLQFAAAAYQVTEGANVTITVTRAGATNNTATVTFATADGTASSGADYVGATNVLTFLPGETAQTVVLAAFEDGVAETPETVLLTLSSPVNATLGSPAAATLTVRDFAAVPGAVDPGFSPGAGANDLVRAIAVQPDGRLLIGGAFTAYATTPRNYIARLNTNGTLDATFNPGLGPDALVSSIALPGDGRVVIGGAFTNVGGFPFNRLARLGSTGAVDYTFNPPFTLNAALNTLAAQSDGKVLLGGAFTQPMSGITRLLTNSGVDVTFNPGSGATPIHALAVDGAGRVLVGGAFTNIGGLPVRRVARLLSSGAVDTNFVPALITNGTVFALAVQRDGRVVVGGTFTEVGGAGRAGLARLNSDGSLDSGFNPGANGPVLALALQRNGKILVGGAFTTLGGAPRNRLGRLLTDGTVDADFDTSSGADGVVYALAATADGKVAVGGDFTQVNGLPRRGIALLFGDFPVPVVIGSGFVGGVFRVTIESAPGFTYALEATQDYTTWIAVDTQTAAGSELVLTDAMASSHPLRFYRVRQTGP